jgi:hypothetical protein
MDADARGDNRPSVEIADVWQSYRLDSGGGELCAPMAARPDSGHSRLAAQGRNLPIDPQETMGRQAISTTGFEPATPTSRTPEESNESNNLGGPECSSAITRINGLALGTCPLRAQGGRPARGLY